MKILIDRSNQLNPQICSQTNVNEYLITWR